MDYSLLLGVHYRAPQHLQSLMSYNRSITAEGLGVLAEEGGCLMTLISDVLLSGCSGCLQQSWRKWEKIMKETEHEKLICRNVYDTRIL